MTAGSKIAMQRAGRRCWHYDATAGKESITSAVCGAAVQHTRPGASTLVQLRHRAALRIRRSRQKPLISIKCARCLSRSASRPTCQLFFDIETLSWSQSPDALFILEPRSNTRIGADVVTWRSPRRDIGHAALSWEVCLFEFSHQSFWVKFR
jgi:hypothetical protein